MFKLLIDIAKKKSQSVLLGLVFMMLLDSFGKD